MSLNIQDAQAAVAAVGPVQPVPLSERVQARQPQSRPQEAFEVTLADVAPVDLDLPPTPDDAAAAVAREAMTRRDDGDRSTAGACAGAPLGAGAPPTVTLPVPVPMLDTPAPRSRPRIAMQQVHSPVVTGGAPETGGATATSARGSAALASAFTPGASVESAAPAAQTPPSGNPSVAPAPLAMPAGAPVQADAGGVPASGAGSEAAPVAVPAPRPAPQSHRAPGAATAQAPVVSPASTAGRPALPAPMQVAPARPASAQFPSDDKASRGDAAASPVAITAPTSTATQSETGADSQSLADARRADANVGTRQQVRAVRQAEALQTAMVQRAEAASQIQVSFSSWGAGHSVTARLDGGRLHMQPSSARVGQALSTAAAPAGVELQIAVDSTDTATDERRQRRGDQGQA
ncbi:hypothetical protein [Stenotrophomonas sp.]|uniref:SpaN/EivJ family type III secretion system needle length determinant n=1 Tax=Stenotrophomonas sp. TaxID=69392 RepID=UPI00289D3FD6|nr:hypothetical protein [Stenotrophomonas sp.]